MIKCLLFPPVYDSIVYLNDNVIVENINKFVKNSDKLKFLVLRIDSALYYKLDQISLTPSQREEINHKYN